MRVRRASLADARLLGRHQIAAALATAVDFALMIALVELAGASPGPATVASATAGGVTNFALARAWAFRARHTGSTVSQATRYAAVSLGGALLNGALLSIAVWASDMPYVLARVAIAITVSLAYTYPLHTRVVFRVEEERA
jgi:putative flippase GtrA